MSRERAGAALLYAALALVMTWPLAAGLMEVVPIGGDNLHLAWALAWIAHTLPTNPLALFDGNIFHPATNAIALSDPNVSSALLVAPLWWIAGSPALLVNVLFLSSFVLCGLSAQALARDWGASPLGALAAGLLFAFAPQRFSHVDHVQLYPFWWTPLALLALDRFLRSGSSRALAAGALFLVLQIYASLYLAAFAAGAVVLHFLVATASGRARLTRATIAKIALAVAATAILCVPLGLAYAEMRLTWGAERSLEQNVRYAASPLAYLSVPADNLVWGRLLAGFADPVAPWEKYLFPGLATMLLAIAAVVREPRSWMLRVAFALVVVGVIGSLGPILVWKGELTGVPLPYLWAWEWVPPFRALRGPARWGLLASLGLALAAAVGASRLPRFLAGLVLAVAVAEAWVLPMPTTPVPATGPSRLDEWLARAANGAVIELPLPPSGGRQYEGETARIYRSAFHWRRIVNGYSGYTPPPYGQLREVLASEPPERVLPILAAWDVRTIVLHSNEMTPDELARWQALVPAGAVRRVHEDGAAIVLELDAAPPPPRGIAARLAEAPTLTAGEWGNAELAFDDELPRALTPSIFGWHRGRASWTAADGSTVETRAKYFCPPIVHRTPAWRTLHVLVPETTGPYRLRLDGKCLELDVTVDVGGASR